jgi:uncharacterized protein (TIGR03435 family)
MVRHDYDSFVRLKFAILPGLIAVGTCLCCGQKPMFHAASVRMADRNSPVVAGRDCTAASDLRQIRYVNVPIVTLPMQAYGVEHADQISGPSALLDMQSPFRYDVMAIAPEGATKAQCEAMLRNLLTERFHLTVHHPAEKILVEQSDSAPLLN